MGGKTSILDPFLKRIAELEKRGLKMDAESRMARAKEQGFVTDVYHGTTTPDIGELKERLRPSEQLGFGIHVTPDPAFASEYAVGDVARKGTSPNVLPLKARLGNTLDATQIVREGTPEFDLAQALARGRLFTQRDEDGVRAAYLQAAIDASSPARAKRLIQGAGYDSVKYKAAIKSLEQPGYYSKGPEAESYTILDPKNVRSRFAAFDPSSRDSRDLLAGAVPATVGAGLTLDQLRAYLAQQDGGE